MHALVVLAAVAASFVLLVSSATAVVGVLFRISMSTRPTLNFLLLLRLRESARAFTLKVSSVDTPLPATRIY
jgi:hypothetical protein